MNNEIKTGFNLLKILNLVNKKVNGNVEFGLHLDGDSFLRITHGGLAYIFKQQTLQKVLDDNNFNNYYQDETEDEISELISKHIINELYMSRGKNFNEIV